jgi:glutathione S-transferase
VKEHLTIADIVLVGRLSPFFIMLIDEKSRKQYPSVMRWFTTITDLP